MATRYDFKILDYREIIELMKNFDYHIFDYDGFRPEVVRDKFLEAGFPREDISKALLLLYMRGTQVSKIKKKTTEDGIALINNIFKALDLKEGSGSDKPNAFVNLSRLGAAFPDVYGSMIVMCDVHRWDLVPGLPKFLTFPGAAAIIPKQRKDVADLQFKWCLEFNKVIGSPSDEKRVKDFFDVSYNSMMISEEKRIVLFQRLEDLLREQAQTSFREDYSSIEPPRGPSGPSQRKSSRDDTSKKPPTSRPPQPRSSKEESGKKFESYTKEVRDSSDETVIRPTYVIGRGRTQSTKDFAETRAKSIEEEELLRIETTEPSETLEFVETGKELESGSEMEPEEFWETELEKKKEESKELPTFYIEDLNIPENQSGMVDLLVQGEAEFLDGQIVVGTPLTGKRFNYRYKEPTVEKKAPLKVQVELSSGDTRQELEDQRHPCL